MDGNISTSLVIGVDIPTPSFNISKQIGGTDFDGYSNKWISQSFPIPFQYGVSAIDDTGIESGLSEASWSKNRCEKQSSAKNGYKNL